MGAVRIEELLRHLRDPLFRHAYTLIVNTGLTSGLGLLYWVLAARLFNPDVVGLNAGVVSSIVFLSGLAQLNLRPVLGRFIPVAGRDSIRLAAGAYGAAIAVAGGAALLFLAGAGWWASTGPMPSIRDSALLAAGFVGATMIWTIFALQDGVLIGLRATAWLTVENVLFGIAKIAAVVALATVAQARDYAIVASWVIPMLATVVVVNLFLFGRMLPDHMLNRAEPGRQVGARRLIRFAAGDYLGSLFALSYVALLPVIVINQVGPAAGGEFYIVWVIASSLMLIPLQMVLSLTVETAADPATFQQQGRRMLIGMMRILLPLCLVTVVIAPLMLSVFGAAYEADVLLLRLLVVAILPYSINVLYVARARVTVKPRRIVAIQAILAVLILGLTFVLIGPRGLEGVGVAFLVGQSVVALAVLATELRPLLRGSGALPGAPTHD